MQNVSTPRIYLNVLEYLATVGYGGTNINPIYRTLPVNTSNTNPQTAFSIPEELLGSQCFLAALGHTARSDVYTCYVSILSENTWKPLSWSTEITDVINNGYASPSAEDGFSIATFEAHGHQNITISGPDFAVGSLVFGIYYDFPHSPDLNLTLSYEYDGIKEITTKGGNTLTNQYYNKPPKWGSLGAWELFGGEPSLARSGRRVWNLNFSYLTDTSVFPSTAALINYESSVSNSSVPTANTLLNEDTFQRVMHLTNGGQLPFIFQSDNTVDATSPSPDQLAICKFDMKSFKFSQQAPNLYRVSLKIREVW